MLPNGQKLKDVYISVIKLRLYDSLLTFSIEVVLHTFRKQGFQQPALPLHTPPCNAGRGGINELYLRRKTSINSIYPNICGIAHFSFENQGNHIGFCLKHVRGSPYSCPCEAESVPIARYRASDSGGIDPGQFCVLRCN